MLRPVQKLEVRPDSNGVSPAHGLKPHTKLSHPTSSSQCLAAWHCCRLLMDSGIFREPMPTAGSARAIRAWKELSMSDGPSRKPSSVPRATNCHDQRLKASRGAPSLSISSRAKPFRSLFWTCTSQYSPPGPNGKKWCSPLTGACGVITLGDVGAASTFPNACTYSSMSFGHLGRSDAYHDSEALASLSRSVSLLPLGV